MSAHAPVARIWGEGPGPGGDWLGGVDRGGGGLNLDIFLGFFVGCFRLNYISVI